MRNSIEHCELLLTGAIMATAFGATLEAARGARAPLFGLITVRDLYDREQAIQTGRLWQRLHLKAALLGLRAQSASRARRP
jgi:hypothetical protein